MINAITQEVCRQIKELRGNENPQSGILLSDLRPGAKITEIKQLLEAAKQRNSFAICIPQWFVSPVKEELSGSQVKIATVVGLPDGTNSPLAKYAEIKQAVAFGADIVLVPVNMDHCRAGDMAAVKKDLAESLTASKGKAEAGAILEVKDLDDSRIIEAAQACESVGAKVIMLSGITGGYVKAETVRALKEKGLSVGVIGGASDASRQQEYQQAGALWIAARYR